MNWFIRNFKQNKKWTDKKIKIKLFNKFYLNFFIDDCFYNILNNDKYITKIINKKVIEDNKHCFANFGNGPIFNRNNIIPTGGKKKHKAFINKSALLSFSVTGWPQWTHIVLSFEIAFLQHLQYVIFGLFISNL